MVKAWITVVSCWAIFVPGRAAVSEAGKAVKVEDRFETSINFRPSANAPEVLNDSQISNIKQESLSAKVREGYGTAAVTTHATSNLVSSRDSPRATRQLDAEKKEKPKQSAPIQEFQTVGAIPDKGWVVALTCLRVAIILYVGPCILFFANHLSKVTSVFQAATINGLWSWWLSFQQVAYVTDVPPLLEGFWKLAFTTGTTSFVMLVSQEFKMILRGALLIHTFVMQQLNLVEVGLMSWAGCDKERNLPGLAIRNQAYDAWMGCTDESEFYAAVWIIKLIEWTVALIGAVIALKSQKYISLAAGAMVGSQVVAAGIEAFITDICSLSQTEEEVADMKMAFLGVRIVLCYILLGLGFLVQLFVFPTDTDIDEKELKDYHWLVRPVACLKVLLPPLSILERILSSSVESIVSKGEEIVRQKTEVYFGKISALDVGAEGMKADDKSAEVDASMKPNESSPPEASPPKPQAQIGSASGGIKPVPASDGTPANAPQDATGSPRDLP